MSRAFQILSCIIVWFANPLNAQIKKITAPGDFAFSTNFSFGDLYSETNCPNDSCTKYTQHFYIRNDTGALLYLLQRNETGKVDTFYSYWYNARGDVLKLLKKYNDNFYIEKYDYNTNNMLKNVLHLLDADTLLEERYAYNLDGKPIEMVGYNHGLKTLVKWYKYLENNIYQVTEDRVSNKQITKTTLKQYDAKGRILLDWLDENGDGEFEMRKHYEYQGDLTIEYKHPYRIMTFRGLPMSYCRKVPVYEDFIMPNHRSERRLVDSIYEIYGENHFDTSGILPKKVDLTSIYRDYHIASTQSYYNAVGLKIKQVDVRADELGGATDRQEILDYVYNSNGQLQEIITWFVSPIYRRLDDMETDVVDQEEMDGGDGMANEVNEINQDADYYIYDYSDFTLDTSVLGREKFNYDEHGNLMEKFNCDFSGIECSGMLSTYDTNNRLVKTSSWKTLEGKRVFDSWVHLYTYDEDGFLKEHLEGNEAEELHSTKYDANGNRTTSGRRESRYFENQQHIRSMGEGLSHTIEVDIPKDGNWQFDLYEANFACLMRLSSERKSDKSILYPIEKPNSKVRNPTYQLKRGTYYLHIVGLTYVDRGVYRFRVQRL